MDYWLCDNLFYSFTRRVTKSMIGPFYYPTQTHFLHALHQTTHYTQNEISPCFLCKQNKTCIRIMRVCLWLHEVWQRTDLYQLYSISQHWHGCRGCISTKINLYKILIVFCIGCNRWMQAEPLEFELKWNRHGQNIAGGNFFFRNKPGHAGKSCGSLCRCSMGSHGQTSHFVYHEKNRTEATQELRIDNLIHNS